MKCFFCKSQTDDGTIRCGDCKGDHQEGYNYELSKGVNLQVQGKSKVGFDDRKAPTYNDLKKYGYVEPT